MKLTHDQLLRWRPQEPLDPRLLIVTVTEDDLHLPEQADRKGSLSEFALTQLLQTLAPLNPRAIGLDIYRDYPLDAASTPFVTALKNQPHFFAVCKVADQATGNPEIAPVTGLRGDRLLGCITQLIRASPTRTYQPCQPQQFPLSHCL